MRIVSLLVGCLIAAAFAGSAPAQSHTVSPPYYSTRPGNTYQDMPFGRDSAGRRWQQIHGDVKGTPMTLAGISLRRAAGGSGMPRRVDMEIVAAHSNLANLSNWFAANYVGAPVTVLGRTTVTLPSWEYSQGSPEPWTLMLPFTTPFPYLAKDDLLWEIRVHGTTLQAPYLSDAWLWDQARDQRNMPQKQVCNTCCSMSQTVTAYTRARGQSLTFGVSLDNGRPNAAAGIMVGLSNPDLTIPGLCTKLCTSGEWTLPWWTDGSGRFVMPPLVVGYDEKWNGQKLYVQTTQLGLCGSGLPVTLSQGQEITLDGFNPGVWFPVQAVFGPLSSLSGGPASEFHIVRFTH